MIGTSAWFKSMRALSMPRPRSADSRCSTVSTDAAPLTSVVCSVLAAAEVRDVRGNLNAA